MKGTQFNRAAPESDFACHTSSWIVALLLYLYAGTASAELSSRALKALTLEELTNLEVTSVSRKEESVFKAAAAITVVTNEDIRRSGATSVPEALRFVPEIHVARRDSSSWAVSSRGFSSINSEKLLVLSDTRSIYTPLYSGVVWSVQDYLLQDVDRIEVIRGPGAALWGSNAVNGVINISTRRAQDTQGLYSEALMGSEERSAGVRFGGTTAGEVSYRFFGKHSDRDSSAKPSSISQDDWRISHAGFRADWEASTADAWTVQGDAYQGNVGQLSPSIAVGGRPGPTGDLETEVSGGNVLARWRRTLDATSDIQVRAYYDRTHRDDQSFRDDLDTFDVDLQHRFAPASNQELIWGVAYRFTDNENIGKGIFAVSPSRSTDSLISAFVQDQISLSEPLQLTLGTKFEHNDFSGFEYQPNVRLSWELSPRHLLWSAIARAVRVPTRLERDIDIDVNPGANPMYRLEGNEDFESEELQAYEGGYRWQAADKFALDLTAFYNRYKGLASLEIGDPYIAADGRTVIPIVNENLNKGRSTGAGLTATLVPLRAWRLIANYSYIDMHLERGGADINNNRFIAEATPRHQFGLRSRLDIADRWQLDAQWRHHAAIRLVADRISAYSELDVRAAWRVTPAMEISLVGQNLLHDEHPEFGSPRTRGEIERSVYLKFAYGI